MVLARLMPAHPVIYRDEGTQSTPLSITAPLNRLTDIQIDIRRIEAVTVNAGHTMIPRGNRRSGSPSSIRQHAL
jgi:hypothetical protein